MRLMMSIFLAVFPRAAVYKACMTLTGNHLKKNRNQQPHLSRLLLPPPSIQMLQGRYQHLPAPLQSQGHPILHWTAALQLRNVVQLRACSGQLFQPPFHNPEERRQGEIDFTRPHRPPPGVSSGGHTSPSSTPLAPWCHQRDESIKFQEGHQVTTYKRGQHHGHYQSRRPSGSPTP